MGNEMLERAGDWVRSLWSNDESGDPPRSGDHEQREAPSRQSLGGRIRSAVDSARERAGEIVTLPSIGRDEDGGVAVRGGALTLGDTRVEGPSAELGIGDGGFHVGGRVGRLRHDDLDVSVGSGNFEIGDVGEGRYGVRTSAGGVEVNDGDEVTGGLARGNLELSAGPGGVVARGAANIGDFGVQDMDAHPDLVDHGFGVGVSMGEGIGIRATSWDNDGDGVAERRVGVDAGPVSVDLMTEDQDNFPSDMVEEATEGRQRVRSEEAREAREREEEVRRRRQQEQQRRINEEMPPPRMPNELTPEQILGEEPAPPSAEEDAMIRSIDGRSEPPVRRRPIFDQPGGHLDRDGRWISDDDRRSRRHRRR